MIFYALLLLLLLSRFSRVRLFATPWNVAHQAPPFMGFSRQEYWSGLPFPSGDLPDPGIEPRSPALQADTGRCFNLWATREAPILMRREKTGIQHRTVKALTLELNLAQFSHSVMSNSLPPHGLQDTRLPCPSPTPGVYSNSCPLSQWCHPTISSSIIPFSSRFQYFPASGYFPMSRFFTSGGQSIGVSASASVLPKNI